MRKFRPGTRSTGRPAPGSAPYAPCVHCAVHFSPVDLATNSEPSPKLRDQKALRVPREYYSPSSQRPRSFSSPVCTIRSRLQHFQGSKGRHRATPIRDPAAVSSDQADSRTHLGNQSSCDGVIERARLDERCPSERAVDAVDGGVDRATVLHPPLRLHPQRCLGREESCLERDCEPADLRREESAQILACEARRTLISELLPSKDAL